MESKVSGFLKETMAPEILDGFMAPALERTFAVTLPFMSAINKAHVVMLGERGILSGAATRALLEAISDLETEGADAFALDPAREEAYFNYEAEVIRRLGAEVGGRMHVARSRNDLKSTVDRLHAREKALAIMAATNALRRTLLDRAEAYADTVMPGYTHLQPAQPVTYGWFLLGVANGLERDHARLSDCYGRLNLSPLGAGAIAGTSFPIDRVRTAELLGFDRPVPHAQDAIACRDAVIELVSASTFLMTTVGRLAQDYYVMTTYEFSTMELPDRVAITSSIMPQKKNMAALENLKGRAAYLLGALTTAFANYKGVPYSHAQDGTADSLRWAWDALDEAVRAVPVARVIVESATPRRARMLQLAGENYSTATDLADVLVREAGLSFRDAHHVVGRVVRLGLDAGLKADDIGAALVDRAAQETLGRPLGLGEETIRTAMDPVKAVESRRHTGGPSRADTADMIAEARDVLERDEAGLRARRARIAEADAALQAAVDAIRFGPVGAARAGEMPT
ncbi:argininosuccinate lyase [Kaustia mangrovi]|uniref:Argininosuccinate lyase n=1 Tax=Kaustia mangrovi TaxID=2593653 RepID=A0A7S8HCY2_9HYPH|nr:argininosuccinate lyase [Kaustia mangrovi]QPC44055.1 argininosuccinate lyase [Kaustia mangrovi]